MVSTVLLVVLCTLPLSSAIGEGTLDVSSFEGIIGGIGRMFETVPTENIEQAKLMGKWHQMYKAAINFDVFRTQMFCPVSYLKSNAIMGNGGFTIEEAYRVISKTGPIETYKRDVTQVSPGKYWMYTEEYFYPSQLHVIAAGPGRRMVNNTEMEVFQTAFTNETFDDEDDTPYDYFIATDANRLRLEVYARDPVTFYAKWNDAVLEFVRANGFGGGSFWNAPQPIYQGADCQWPNEREVFARRVLRNQQQGRATGLGGSLLSGLNPQAALKTFRGLFGGAKQESTIFRNNPNTQQVFRGQQQAEQFNFNNQIGQRS